MPNFGMRVSDVTRRSRPFPGKKKNITLRFLNEATSARGALSGAHAVPRLFRAPSPTLRTRTTRSNDPRPDLLAPHLPGDPSRSIRRNFPRLAVGRRSSHVVLPRRRRGRDRRALTPRRCAQDQRPDAPGTRLRHPEPSIPPPPRGELPHARPRVRPKGQFITWRLPGVLAADDAVPRRAARAVIVASPRAPRRRRHHARAPDPRRRPKIHAKPTDRIPPPLPPSP